MSADTSPTPGTSASAGPAGVSHVRRVLILWVVLSVISVVATVIIFPLINPTSASAVAGFANTTNVVFTALAMPVVMFVL
ncbi:MAG: hypothetical protein ACLP22_22425, partial [Solirubrobacteraceae bacterium]